MCKTCNPGASELASAVIKGATFNQVPGPAASAPTSASDGRAKIFSKGTIITMKDGELSPVEALAIKDDTIIAAGDYNDVLKRAGDGADEVHLDQKCILPGFVEPHLHLMLTALTRHYFLSLSPIKTTTLDEAENLIREKLAVSKPDDWIVGFGYDPSRVEDHPDLTKSFLDGITTAHPIYILNQSGHVGYINSKALEIAKVDESTKDPSFLRGPDGKLTGVILEEAIALVGQHIPPAPGPDVYEWCMETLNFWLSKGCTTVFDAGIGSVAGDIDLLIAVPKMPLRFIGALTIQLVEKIPIGLIKSPKDFQLGDAKIQAIKFWADGSTQGFTAAVHEPYLNRSGKGSTGNINYTKEDLQKIMTPWLNLGWQLVVHSNGDRATDMTLDTFENLFGANPNRDKSIMHRIEHFTVTTTKQVERAARLGLGVSHTMGHVYYWGETFFNYVIGKERASRIHAIKDDLDTGIVYSFHSDSPVTDVDPILWVKTAMTRQTYQNKLVYSTDQCVDLAESLRAITINAAKQIGVEKSVGSLEEGKSADFVIVDQDPRKMEKLFLDMLTPLETWVRGERVWFEEVWATDRD